MKLTAIDQSQISEKKLYSRTFEGSQQIRAESGSTGEGGLLEQDVEIRPCKGVRGETIRKATESI